MEFFKKYIDEENKKYILFYYKKFGNEYAIGCIKRKEEKSYYYNRIIVKESVLNAINKENIEDAIYNAIMIQDISKGKHCSTMGPLDFVLKEWEDEFPNSKLDKSFIKSENLYIG